MFRRLIAKRFIRTLLWLFITLVTFIILLFVWTNWSGRRRWAAAKAMIEGEGETLEFRKLLPATPPEETNLLAIEALRGITETVDNDDEKGEPGLKRKALAAMKWDAKGAKLPAANGVTLGQAADMAQWAKFLREVKFLDLPADAATPGRNVLHALDAKFPLLKELADAAPKRTQAMFTPGLRERELPGLLFALRIPHYTAAPSLARLLCLRARAAVEAKDSGEAARSLLAASRIGFARESEPMLIGFLVGITAEMMVTETLWLGLRERVFVDDDLRMLQEVLSGAVTDKALLQSLRSEMAMALNSLEFLQDAAAGRKQGGEDVTNALSIEGGILTPNAYRLLPDGLHDHWKSVIAEMELRYLIQPLKQEGITGAARVGDALDREIMEKQNFLLHPDYIMAQLTIPAIQHVSAVALLAQARTHQAVMAVTLERFFGKHANYPARLDELVPEFLPAVPLDPCDGKAMRYRVTNNGRYLLWSVAFDGKDDAGKVNVTRPEDSVALRKPGYLGDWTWQYEPVTK